MFFLSLYGLQTNAGFHQAMFEINDGSVKLRKIRYIDFILKENTGGVAFIGGHHGGLGSR